MCGTNDFDGFYYPAVHQDYYDHYDCNLSLLAYSAAFISLLKNASLKLDLYYPIKVHVNNLQSIKIFNSMNNIHSLK